MMQGNFTFRFFVLIIVRVYLLYMLYVYYYNIAFCCVYIYICIIYIIFICVSLVSLIDYLYIHTAIRYLPLVFPVLSLFPFVPQFVRTRLDSSVDDVVNGALAA